MIFIKLNEDVKDEFIKYLQDNNVTVYKGCIYSISKTIIYNSNRNAIAIN